jgi:hypothetical protein
MSKYEVLQLRKLIADSEFVENVIIRLNELNIIYAQNMESIEKIAENTDDYELMTSALWDAYEHEITVLKEMCIKHHVSKANMFKIFK